MQSQRSIDRLPQVLKAKILSSVPTKLAASTSVLSKGWRNVFPLVHNLDFDDSDLLHPEEGKEEMDSTREGFKNFVSRTLALQNGSPIEKFSLKCHIYNGLEMRPSLKLWINSAVERGVTELELSLQNRCQPSMDPPEILLHSELVTCKTLVKLTLGKTITLGKLPPDVSLPVLKSLFIDSIYFSGEDLSKVLLPGCPVLEELSVNHEQLYGTPCHISSKTIKKLSVYCDVQSDIDHMGDGMSFDAPSLVFLDYSDYALSQYPEVNLGSLVEAELDITYSKEQVKRPDLSGLLTGISNVKTLQLSPDSADVIGRCVKHGLVLPMYNNLVTLSFGSGKVDKRGWKLLPLLLEQSPMLETLSIGGLLGGYSSGVSLSPYRVKVLNILVYERRQKELVQLERFIKGTKCLELLRVEVEEKDGVLVDDAMIAETYGDLLTMVTTFVSSKCKIQVIRST